MKYKLLTLMLALLPATLPALAQGEGDNTLTVNAQLRERGEYRNGNRYPRSEGDRHDLLLNSRARLTIDFAHKNLSMRLSAHHVGAWAKNGTSEQGRLLMNEAWAQLKLDNGFFAKIGRQTLVYDDQRLLSASEWTNTGRSHDAVKLGYEKGAHRLHGFVTFIDSEGSTNTNLCLRAPYSSIQALWYHYGLPETPFNASLLFLNSGVRVGDDANKKTKGLQTMGTYLTYRVGDWKAAGMCYYQMGRNEADASVSAWMAGLNLTYAPKGRWKGMLAYEYLSGDKPGTEKFNAFNVIYGTKHGFYGEMDYFYSTPYIYGEPGLQDLYTRWEFTANHRLDFVGTLHNFMTAVKVDDLSRQLGTEIDLKANWKVYKDVMLTVGYSTYFGTKTMDVVKGGDHTRWQDWGWISVNVNPCIFATKW